MVSSFSCDSNHAAVSVGMWTLVSSIVQLGMMWWQMVRTKIEKEHSGYWFESVPGAAIDYPTYMVNYRYDANESLYKALNMSQTVCMIAAFFVIAASILFIFGVRKRNKLFIWIWFLCVAFSTISSFVYCVIYYSGKTRSDLVEVTIVESLIMLLNVYCAGVVTMYYCQQFLNSNQNGGTNERREENETSDPENHHCKVRLFSCFCFNSSNGTLTVAMWSLVYAIGSFIFFGWQINIMTNCRSLIFENSLHCPFNCPCIGSFRRQTAAFIEVLFLIQILCLVSAFFLIFASFSLISGANARSNSLILPWFPCMITSILANLSYCIVWWTGNFGSFWIEVTITLIAFVLINIYCVVVVLIYYREINSKSERKANDQELVQIEKLICSDDKKQRETPPPEYQLTTDPNPTCPDYSETHCASPSETK